MLYRYKRSAEGNVVQRKARYNLRGDMMKPGIHYNPKPTTTYSADRTTHRMLIALHARHQMPLEHFDIRSAYLHENYEHDRPIYVTQMPRFDGTYTHQSKNCQLIGNSYSSSPAAYYYNHGLKTFLTQLNFVPSEHDPCLYVKYTAEGTTLVSTTIDDFLVLASAQRHIDTLHHQLLTKYKTKRLGTPTRFLNWAITHGEDGTIHIAKPDAIGAILEQTQMSKYNPTATPYQGLHALDQQPPTKPLSTHRRREIQKYLGKTQKLNR
eukprot:gb/GEZJ01001361.1/.p1 GENE.gb/GEZJ01001361.1/~~gb/GEZJ01001361.1/.p1  ORF type:complete len:266 (-),score=12.80 gb/GEZJ01001361.1/:823-1620(-)